MSGEAEYLTVNNIKIPYSPKEVDIFKVDFYKENPRINYIVSKMTEEEVTSQSIYNALFQKESTKDLIKDIEENGGLLEPILVINNLVIEGNTRLCAYRRLLERTQDEKWKYIKANVVSVPVSKKTIYSILSNYHIKGKNPWDPYEKAAIMKKMFDEGYSHVEIAKMVGTNKRKVETTLKAYETMKDKYLSAIENEREEWDSIGSDTEHLKKYSYFEAFYTDKDLNKRAQDTPGFIDEFVEWVLEGRISKAQDVRELNNILKVNRAKKVFCEYEPEEAFIEAKLKLHWDRPDKVDPYYRLFETLREQIADSEINIIKEQIDENPHRKHTIKKCFSDLKKFCKELDIVI